MGVTLVLGGARSGKSRYAEGLADQWLARNKTGKRLYIATAQILDEEMRTRVMAHQKQRGQDWETLEEPLFVGKVLQKRADAETFILVDCLTLWLTTLLLEERDYGEEVAQLTHILPQLPGDIVLVSNEVSLGIVPENKLARRFRDIQGRANQNIAAISDKVVFIAAGLPLVLKDG